MVATKGITLNLAAQAGMFKKLARALSHEDPLRASEHIMSMISIMPSLSLGITAAVFIRLIATTAVLWTAVKVTARSS